MWGYRPYGTLGACVHAVSGDEVTYIVNIYYNVHFCTHTQKNEDHHVTDLVYLPPR